MRSVRRPELSRHECEHEPGVLDRLDLVTQRGIHPEQPARHEPYLAAVGTHEELSVERLHEQREGGCVLLEHMAGGEGEHDDPDIRMRERRPMAESLLRHWRASQKIVDHGEGGVGGVGSHPSTLAPDAQEWDGGSMTVRIKRIYEDPDDALDGYRILVDRIWPRGVSKERARLDLWLKEVAPTTELRTWFHHEEPKWPEFQKRYRAELAENPAVEELRALIATHDPVTLLYSAHDEAENQAVVLLDFLG